MATEKDMEKSYPTKEVAAKLRRLADALEEEKTFEIQIAGNASTSPLTQQLSSSISARARKRKLRSK